ncbi:RNA polymerase sigma-I factor [Virgibacillus xinjiangensis]|uniref:RNA polymerase sigma factor SigI n=1 Tax=Virgibacillus xinjiangensis TaxID=393090 RepID=A0ABV7CR22_9BACI
MMSSRLNDPSLEEMVEMAQNGDHSIQNYILDTYKPFIATCVCEVCKRYIDPHRDDEFSIGLSAFNDAIFSYSPERGSSFLSFAKLVVKRRVIDYIRSMVKRPKVVSLDETYDMDRAETPREITAVQERYQIEKDAWHLREEIADFKEKLAEYKLSLAEIADVSPKHRDARESAIHTAMVLYDDEHLREKVQKKQKLPIKELVKSVNVSKKTLERNRKFILAIFIILSEDYLYLKDYLKGVDGCQRES